MICPAPKSQQQDAVRKSAHILLGLVSWSGEEGKWKEVKLPAILLSKVSSIFHTALCMCRRCDSTARKGCSICLLQLEGLGIATDLKGKTVVVIQL